MAKLSDEDAGYLRETARTGVRGGYDDAEDIEETLIEIATEADPPVGKREAQRIARTMLIEEIEALQRDQANWPVLTDYDRLRLAFDKLEDEGIVARENFSCCGTCGAAEIGDEIPAFEAAGRRAKGYVFFHMQDTESAVDGGGLYFGYGAFDEPHEPKSLAVGHRLFETLESVGLKARWNGDLGQRVHAGLDWKRRWTGPVPSPPKRWFF